MKANIIRGRMAELGITGDKLAREMSMNPKTFYIKMSNGTFSLEQAKFLTHRLELENPADIFLS